MGVNGDGMGYGTVVLEVSIPIFPILQRNEFHPLFALLMGNSEVHPFPFPLWAQRLPFSIPLWAQLLPSLFPMLFPHTAGQVPLTSLPIPTYSDSVFGESGSRRC